MCIYTYTYENRNYLFKGLFLRFFIGNLQNTKDHVIFGKEYEIGSVSKSLDFI